MLEEIKLPVCQISLIGGLKLYGQDGSDMTAKLSPTLRQLLLYIILRSHGTGKSVPTDEVNDVLWPGIGKADAANNRNVNLHKLRVALKEAGDMSIVLSNDMLSLSLGEGIHCDYVELMAMLKKVEAEEVIDLDLLAKILLMCNNGTLLPACDYEWLATFKSRFSEIMIRIMTRAAHDSRVNCDDRYMFRVANCILNEDCLDDFAIRTKCRVLFRRGQKALSRNAYEKWRSDYRRIMGAEPEMEYKDIIL